MSLQRQAPLEYSGIWDQILRQCMTGFENAVGPSVEYPRSGETKLYKTR